MMNKLMALKNNDGITLKNGKEVNYKTGYQVATEGVEVTSAKEAAAVISSMRGNCGIWLSEGVYYIDKCHRVTRKCDAIAEGIAHNQQSIYDWKKQELIWLNK